MQSTLLSSECGNCFRFQVPFSSIYHLNSTKSKEISGMMKGSSILAILNYDKKEFNICYLLFGQIEVGMN